jgi:hypothetical protein
MRSVSLVLFTVLLLAARSADAQDEGPLHAAIANAFTADLAMAGSNAQSPAPRQLAFEYSDGYKTRAKIHKYASFATLPLFATEYALGSSIYNNPSDVKKGAHVAVGSAIVGLYGVQAVTGVWNLVEARKDPHGRTRRMVHGILMLASGAGFAITPMVAPGDDFRFGFGGSDNRSLHRNVAITSIAIGTVGYLTMLIGGK